MLRHFIIAFILLCFVASPVTLATNKTLLDRISHKISSIKRLIHRDTSKRQQLQHDLAKTETSSSEITKQLNTTKQQLNHQQELLNTLKNNQRNFQQQLITQQTLLDHQIQMAYILGRQSYLKLLLNQEDSNEISRILMYYHFINQNRIEAIADIQKTLAQIKANQQAITTQYQVLQTLKTQQQNQQQQLAAAQAKRQHLLSTLNKNIQTRQQRLDALIADKRRLAKTLAQIARRSVHFPQVNFAKLHKRLAWPTHGRVLQIFGTQIEQSELRWGGVLIKAPAGQPVYAIAKGKVVFAKWLSGYGLLLIVNHGNGYMTLYGRNHLLYKKVGDIVHRGDLIATVGQTGGHSYPALYFAVRHNGKPINPALFISKES